jgi:hypothetical protein
MMRLAQTVIEWAGIHSVNMAGFADGVCERDRGVALAAPELQDTRTRVNRPLCYE